MKQKKKKKYNSIKMKSVENIKIYPLDFVSIMMFNSTFEAIRVKFWQRMQNLIRKMTYKFISCLEAKQKKILYKHI